MTAQDSFLLKDYSKEKVSFKTKLIRIKNRIANYYFMIRTVLQRIFDKDHLAYLDIFETASHLAPIIYKNLIRFKKMERFGHPSYFREYYDQEWKSKEEYEQAALNGQIDLEVAAGVISGQDKWEQTLDKMIFAFDWITHAQDHLDDKVANEFYKRHNLKNPHAKIQENICKEYVYEILPEEKKRQENETPYVKEFGGLAPEMMSSESDLHIKHPDKYKLLGVKDLYYDYEYEDEKIRKEVDEGLKLFGRFYLSLWD